MPLTTIDPKTALIVIDLQNGLIAYPKVHPISEIVAKAAFLANTTSEILDLLSTRTGLAKTAQLNANA